MSNGPFPSRTDRSDGAVSAWPSSGRDTRCLAAGLLLVLGAEIAGDWLYQAGLPKMSIEQMKARPSPIVGELRWLALLLVVAGTYAYIYSDIVVRHVGVYVHIAAATLMWSLVLALAAAERRPWEWTR